MAPSSAPTNEKIYCCLAADGGDTVVSNARESDLVDVFLNQYTTKAKWEQFVTVNRLNAPFFLDKCSPMPVGVDDLANQPMIKLKLFDFRL
jgi:hypothetical protein